MGITSLTLIGLPGMSSGDVENRLTAHFSAGVAPPFSFTCDGKPSAQFIKGWQFSHQQKSLDDVRTQHVFTNTDPDTQLQVRCECVLFKDFPAVEWGVQR